MIACYHSDPLLGAATPRIGKIWQIHCWIGKMWQIRCWIGKNRQKKRADSILYCLPSSKNRRLKIMERIMAFFLMWFDGILSLAEYEKTNWSKGWEESTVNWIVPVFSFGERSAPDNPPNLLVFEVHYDERKETLFWILFQCLKILWMKKLVNGDTQTIT